MYLLCGEKAYNCAGHCPRDKRLSEGPMRESQLWNSCDGHSQYVRPDVKPEATLHRHAMVIIVVPTRVKCSDDCHGTAQSMTLNDV